MVALSSSASGSGCPVSVRTCHNFTLSNFRTASDCQGLRKGPATRSKGSGMELSKLRPVFVRLLNRCPTQTRPNRRVEAQALDLHRPRPPTRGARVHAVAPAGPAPATGQRRKGAAVAWAPPARLQEPSQVKVALLLGLNLRVQWRKPLFERACQALFLLPIPERNLAWTPL